MAIEQPAYRVLLKEGDFELRLYEPMLTVHCRESDLGGGEGFSKLFNYIGGNNESATKISMTKPVLNYPAEPEPTMAFVVPARIAAEGPPQPNDPALEVRSFAERQVAVLRFAGKISPEVIGQKQAQLLQWLADKHWTPAGEVALARYNPPIVPGFFRHNELLVEVNTEDLA